MNSGRTIDLKAATFTKPNSLIYRSNEPTHRIINFKEPERNIELKMMVLERQAVFNTKKGAIHQFLVADQTACCYMNYFNQTGRIIEIGDILYVNGVYTTLFKGSLLLYQGSCSIVKRIGKWHMKFNPKINISLAKKQEQDKKELQPINY